MNGYNRFEQAVGTVLDRFPRLKAVAETAYQRTNYHVFARGFDYEIHDDATLYPIEQLFGLNPTNAPTQFVGFYDITPWNQPMEGVVLHERSTDLAPDEAAIVAITNSSATRIAITDAWNYQQGSRTQWHPTNSETVIFNDLEEGSPVARTVDLDGTTVETVPYHVAAMHPLKDEFLSVDYRRLDKNSPAYGYGMLTNQSAQADLAAPDKDGIYKVSGSSASLIVSFESLLERCSVSVPVDNHYLHHLLYAPNGERFVFLHRWIDGSQRQTRLLGADFEGTLSLLLEDRYVSHFCWLDNERIFLWGRTEEHGKGYHIIDVTTGNVRYVDALDGYGDGHPSLSPDSRWIVTDTYPDRSRIRHLALHNLETERVVPLGSFSAPFEFDGAVRCDLHPRWSPNGRFISIDSAHEGSRRSYAIDVGGIVS